MRDKNRYLKLTESAVMIALSTVLSLLTIANLPFGGSVTPFSMLPLIVIAYRYGTKWGLFTGVIYGLVQMILGLKNLSYATSFLAVVIIILFDYLLAFGVMGIGGAFKKRISNQGLAMGLGALAACALRFGCHFISGCTVWSMYAEDMPVWLYSLVYNASYMIPEAIVTVLGAVLVSLFLDFSTSRVLPMKHKKKEL
ncbi:MAG TPA: energy-coupled thiamine transporter ThiT [Clostridiales bacterium]|nr:energy-coupled thiamine transporter ThiT [Clostridiales bacterium]